MAKIRERAPWVRSTLVDRIERVDLRVRDVGQSLAFYRDVVGLEVAAETDARAELRAPGGPVFLTLQSAGVTEPADPRSAGLFHIAIRFPDRPSLGDALARLANAEAAIGAGDHAVSEALYVDDPDGNGVELYYDRPADQWPPPSGDMFVPMVTLPVDLQALFAAGRGRAALGGPAARGTDMGHVHLQASDLDATIRFYTEEIGLDLTARLGGQAGFFSSNVYHYHIGANTWNSRGSAPASKNRAGLERIVFATDDREQLERLRLRLAEYGRTVSGEEDGEAVVEDPNGIELRFIEA